MADVYSKTFLIGSMATFQVFLKNLNTSNPDIFFSGGILKIIQ